MRLLSTMTPPPLRLVRRRRTALARRDGTVVVEEVTTTIEVRVPAALGELKRRLLAWFEPELRFNPALG